MNAIPAELIERIFFYLEPEQELAVALTCRCWHSIVRGILHRESRKFVTKVRFAYYSLACYKWACKWGLPARFQQLSKFAGGFGTPELCEYLHKEMVKFDVQIASIWAVRFGNNATFEYIRKNYKTLAELPMIGDEPIGISTNPAKVYYVETEAEEHNGDSIKAALAEYQKERAAAAEHAEEHITKMQYGAPLEEYPDPLYLNFTANLPVITDEQGELTTEQADMLAKYEEEEEFDYKTHLLMGLEIGEVEKFFTDDNYNTLLNVAIKADNLEMYKFFTETEEGKKFCSDTEGISVPRLCVVNKSRRIFDYTQGEKPVQNGPGRFFCEERDHEGFMRKSVSVYTKIIANGWYDLVARLDILQFTSQEWLACHLRGNDRLLQELAAIYEGPLGLHELPLDSDIINDDTAPAILEEIRDRLEIVANKGHTIHEIATTARIKYPQLSEWIYQEWMRRHNYSLDVFGYE